MIGNKILLVDDEPGLLEVCRETLEERGVDVFTAVNGLQALKVLESARVDLIVSDLRMSRLDGMGLLRKIKESGLDVDVIFLTGFGTVENAVDCLRLGATDYLLKPFDVKQLLLKIENALRGRKLRMEQKKFSNLATMLNLSNTLGNQKNLRSLIKEFFVQVREAFTPDHMAMFFPEADGKGMEIRVSWGRFFKVRENIRDWFKALSRNLLEQGGPRLFDPAAMKEASPTGKTPPHELASVSAMAAPVASGRSKIGVVVVLREKERPAYTLQNLHLLTVFAAYAASAFENLRGYRRLKNMNIEIITSHVSAVEAKDFYTKGHSERVSSYSVLLGKELGLPDRDLRLLSFAGMLHDIGKIGIPDNILNKNAPLTEEELAIMKQHPVVGRDILSRVKTLHEILPIVYHHHEWWDGTGYPEGLHRENIPFLARVITVIDGFEAIVSNRAYQNARPVAEAREILFQGAGVQWDPDIINAWLRVLDKEDVTKKRFIPPLYRDFSFP